MAKEKENISADALDETLKQIQKLFGKGAVMRLGEREAVDVDAISSGSLLLDEALGVGGYPKGRIIEIFGPESSGKTTFSFNKYIRKIRCNSYCKRWRILRSSRCSQTWNSKSINTSKW